jgi:PST family polysaccharide transporter
MGSIPILLSFALALAWGPLRIVQAFAVTNLTVVLPMLFWWAGRRGPVTIVDLWKTLLAVLPYMVVMATINLSFHFNVAIDRPIIGLLITASLSCVGWLLVAMVTSSGQNLLQNLAQLQLFSRIGKALLAGRQAGQKP